jgi:hypothetical protein
MRRSIGLLLLCLLLVANNASATHFRYGTFRWEKNLAHPNPAEFKVRVTYDVGARWSFPWGTVVSTCPPSPFVPTGSTGTGNCPPVGATVNFGAVVFNKPVKVNTATTATIASISMSPVVSSVISERDLFYGQFAFDLTFSTTSNPVQLDWTNCCRLSQILEGNNDQNWRMLTIIDAAPPNTKSPISTSLPLITVTTGQTNTLFFPSQSFDNTINKFRISTFAESQLPKVVPTGFVLSTVTQGAATFVPPVSGLYAVQMMITSFDSNNVARSSVPLDLLLEAKPFSAANPTLALTANGPLVRTVSVGSTLNFVVTAALTPASSSFTVSISNTPLPAGATFTPVCAPCLGNVNTDYQFSWSPTLTSVSSVICFQAIALPVGGTSTVISPGMLCMTINIGALPTSMIANPANGVCGGPVNLLAQLSRTADLSPMTARPLSFSLNSDPSTVLCTPAATLTNTTGWAKCSFTSTAPINPPADYTAKFSAVVNEFLESSASSSVLISKAATTSLNVPVLTTLASVGYPLGVSAVLNRIYTDGGLFAPAGQPVDFTLTQPSAPPISSTGNVVGLAGLASATISPGPMATGSHSIQAFFAGSSCLFGPATNTVSFPVYQRTQLSVSAGGSGGSQPTCGNMFTISAHLQMLPSGQPIPATDIVFSFSAGSNIPGQIAATDLNGDATITVLSSQAMSVINVTASFNLAGGSFSNRNGQLSNEVSTIGFSIVPAVTNLVLSAPSVGAVTIPLLVSAVLTTGGNAVPGANVLFSLLGPGGATATRNAVTNLNGYATPTSPFVPSVTGTHQITVSYAGNTCLSHSFDSLGPVSVGLMLPTQISVNPSVSATCGLPLAVTARLTTTVGAAVPNQPLTFAVGLTILCYGVMTNSAGFATCTFIPESNASSSLTVTFDGVPGFYGSSAANAVYTVGVAQTWLSAMTVTGADFVGDTITVSTTLTKMGGPVVGVPLTISYGPNQSGVFTVITSSSGSAFTVFSLENRGLFTIEVSFQGDACNGPAFANATIAVFQKTYLIVNAAQGICDGATVISAGLHADSGSLLPMVMNGQQVDFILSGSSSAPAPTPSFASAVTDAFGVATVSAVYPQAGLFLATASFMNLDGYFVDQNGNPIPTQSSADVTIYQATTALADFPLPAYHFTGDSVQLDTTLDRVAVPLGPSPLYPLCLSWWIL